MGDVADILSMAGAVAAAGTVSGSQRKPNGGVKKPDGMSREVFALLGNASLPPCVQTAGFQNNKAELAAKKAVPWLWAEFSNSARSDGFKLKHWQRASNVLSDYAFARFNKRTAVVSYTDEEYAQVDVANDGWTKEDTDYLFELCAQYDLRWYVVQDRWERHREVTVTDIKNRYFSVSKKIITSRRAKKLVVASMSTPPVDAPTATVSAKAMAQTENAILDFNYDAEYDRKRTLQLARLYSRPASEEKEETNLLNEIRRTDMQLRRLQQDQPKVSLISKRKKSAHTPPPSIPANSSRHCLSKRGKCGSG
uniref:dAMP1 SANT/Myb-like domain-containing protein n=1 Tax=Mucochytrium quahogii TaxID=96639 RepID=A0A7S2W4D2_9STRA|mmetsp:Transcript_12518/g.26878  ORF Transcript_12518/g.26878 Transcript_12518/m.26878 type:complete len:309 (+) Transcript_12518:582-1508(+)